MTAYQMAFNYAQDPLWLLTATLAIYIGWPVWNALCDVCAFARRWRRRTYARRLREAYETAGVVYRVGSPPSHAAGGAR